MSDPTMPPTVSYQSATALTETDPGQRSQAMVAHLLGILGLLGAGIYYLIKRNDPTAGPFVRANMKEVLNWEIFVAIAYVALVILGIILGMIVPKLLFLVGLLYLVLFVGNIILVVMAALKANKGEAATYPTPVKLVK